MPKIKDPMFWNVKLPDHKLYLRDNYSKLNKHANTKRTKVSKADGPIEHFEGILRENCRRLLNGTALACKQAGAIFRLSAKWEDAREDDFAGKWITAKNKVTMFGVGQKTDYHPYVWDQLIKNLHDPIAGEKMSEDCCIDPRPFLQNEVPLFIDPEVS